MVFAMFLVKGFKAKTLFAIFMLPKQVLAPLLLAPKKMVLIVVVLNTNSPSRKLGTFKRVQLFYLPESLELSGRWWMLNEYWIVIQHSGSVEHSFFHLLFVHQNQPNYH